MTVDEFRTFLQLEQKINLEEKALDSLSKEMIGIDNYYQLISFSSFAYFLQSPENSIYNIEKLKIYQVVKRIIDLIGYDETAP